MDEVLKILRAIELRITNIEQSIDDIRSIHRPMNSHDFTSCLKTEVSIEYSSWLSSITVCNGDILNLLKQEQYQTILQKLDYSNSLKVFKHKKNIIFIYKNEKWGVMNSEDISLLQNKLFNIIRHGWTNLSDNDKAIIKLSYLEQRDIISLISKSKPAEFRQNLYKILTSDSVIN